MPRTLSLCRMGAANFQYECIAAPKADCTDPTNIACSSCTLYTHDAAPYVKQTDVHITQPGTPHSLVRTGLLDGCERCAHGSLSQLLAQLPAGCAHTPLHRRGDVEKRRQVRRECLGRSLGRCELSMVVLKGAAHLRACMSLFLLGIARQQGCWQVLFMKTPHRSQLQHKEGPPGGWASTAATVGARTRQVAGAVFVGSQPGWGPNACDSLPFCNTLTKVPHPVQMHIHVALVESSLQTQLFEIARHPSTSWTYISCPPAGSPSTHRATQCTCGLGSQFLQSYAPY